MTRYNATIEHLPGQRAAIITLETTKGEWAGAQRINLPRSSKSDLYEFGYTTASISASGKGGTLDSYRAVAA